MYKMLLVDDEADTREALSSYFPWHDIDFEIIGQCGNGQEALQMIRQRNDIDVILTDIRMPVMSGIDLASAIHEQKLNIQIIFLSSYREFEYARQALLYRVHNYIVKPAKYQVIMDVFRQLKQELDTAKQIPEPIEEDSAREGILIRQVKTYVRENLKDATLESAAQHVHLNANYLSYLFKKKTNQNFTDYVIEHKMKISLKLLQESHYKTYEISEMVGYSNAKNFSRTFKSFFGKTPSDFRNG